MHSHDRTLLSSLAFGDKDKNDSRHDMACRYLCLPEVGKELVQKIRSNWFKLGSALLAAVNDKDWIWFTEIYEPNNIISIESVSSNIDIHIAKGEGKYRTTIGFADVILQVTCQGFDIYYSHSACDEYCITGCSVVYKDSHILKVLGNKLLLIEAKINPLPVGDIIRQMNLYREYLLLYNNQNWIGTIVACAFPLNEDEIQSLRTENILYVYLGEKFTAYCEKQMIDNRSARQVSERFEV